MDRPVDLFIKSSTSVRSAVRRVLQFFTTLHKVHYATIMLKTTSVTSGLDAIDV